MIKQILLDVIQWVRTLIRKNLHSQNEDLPYYVTILISGIIFIVALNGFVELTDELAENELTTFDESVTEYVLSFRNDTLTSYFKFCTEMGDRYAYMVITLVLAAYYYIKRRSWKFIAQTAIVLILATLSNVGLKKVINRSRPELDHLVSVNTLSYPSGHSMSAMAFYGFLIYLCIRHKMSQPLRTVVIALLVFIILSIGVSRIYLGVHFPSDVAAGFVGGLLWVAFCAVTFNVFELWRRRRNMETPVS